MVVCALESLLWAPLKCLGISTPLALTFYYLLLLLVVVVVIVVVVIVVVVVLPGG